MYTKRMLALRAMKRKVFIIEAICTILLMGGIVLGASKAQDATSQLAIAAISVVAIVCSCLLLKHAMNIRADIASMLKR